jgi:hypothetical protein
VAGFEIRFSVVKVVVVGIVLNAAQSTMRNGRVPWLGADGIPSYFALPPNARTLDRCDWCHHTTPFRKLAVTARYDSEMAGGLGRNTLGQASPTISQAFRSCPVPRMVAPGARPTQSGHRDDVPTLASHKPPRVPGFGTSQKTSI